MPSSRKGEAAVVKQRASYVVDDQRHIQYRFLQSSSHPCTQLPYPFLAMGHIGNGEGSHACLDASPLTWPLHTPLPLLLAATTSRDVLQERRNTPHATCLLCKWAGSSPGEMYVRPIQP
ncbi:hypothetical protein V2G26_020313 [Clonostachys chloroleuca]